MKKLFLIFLIIPISAFAEYITNDIVAACDSSYFYSAVLVPKQITCLPGYYLPANALSCVLCPSGYICNGGTYEYNPDIFQGATYKNPISNNMNNICATNAPGAFNAVFRPKTITLNWNDGTNTTTTQCSFGETITIPNPPTRPGYKFGGWRVKRRN